MIVSENDYLYIDLLDELVIKNKLKKITSNL